MEVVVTARIVAAAAAVLCLLAPRIAAACPSCAGNDGGGIGPIVLLGLMILLPFGIAYVIYRVIRAADSRPSRVGRLP